MGCPTALVGATTEHDKLQQEKETLPAELLKLRTLYDQLLKDSWQENQQILEGCQRELAAKEELIAELN